ncbi:uncharacterized protein LOC141820298 [Curcuma longa]|uniref:uncharacterized protein LOC141820298 n=1 Tax=Curcuma longa TaxID=136217 RepID=UPI003D9E73D8
MRALGCLGIALSLLSGCILLAIVAELYYFFWWKKRVAERDSEVDAHASPVRDLLQLFNWKKPCPPPADGGAPRSDDEQLHLDSKDLLLKLPEEEDDAAEEELMTLAAPQRSLFTITEETQEDLEAAGGSRRVRKSRAGSKGMSLRDWLQSAETPVLTPLSSPPFFSPPTGCYNLMNGVNPLFEPSWEDDSGWPWPSPPPKLKFLMAAEAKLHKKTLMEEASREHCNPLRPLLGRQQTPAISSLNY